MSSYKCCYCLEYFDNQENFSNHRESCSRENIDFSITKRKRKKKISPEKRFNVWKTHIGNSISSFCLCCNIQKITPFTSYHSFQAGHIISEAKGGTTDIGNLLPICSSCNKRMGSMHWDDFVD